MHIKHSLYSHVTFIFLPFILLLSQDSSCFHSQPSRRADDSPCGPEIYCLPRVNDTWTMSSTGIIRWNSNYPTFVVQSYVDVRLYEATDLRSPVLTRLNTTNGDGYLSLYLDPNLQPPIFASMLNRPLNSTVVRIYSFLITVAGDDIANKPMGPFFFIQDPPIVNETATQTSMFSSAIASTPTITTLFLAPSTPTSINNPNSSHDPSTDLSRGAIAGISVGCLAVLAAGIALIYYRKHNRKFFVKASIGKNSSQDDFEESLPGSRSTRRLNSMRLTANDARLIAETYRRILRKPSWSTAEDQEAIQMRTGCPSASASSIHSTNLAHETTS